MTNENDRNHDEHQSSSDETWVEVDGVFMSREVNFLVHLSDSIFNVWII